MMKSLVLFQVLVNLTKSGAGTLVLTATNTFTGNITISAGTLKIDGTGTLEEWKL